MCKDYMSLELLLLLDSECWLRKIVLLPPASGRVVLPKHDHSGPSYWKKKQQIIFYEDDMKIQSIDMSCKVEYIFEIV